MKSKTKEKDFMWFLEISGAITKDDRVRVWHPINWIGSLIIFVWIVCEGIGNGVKEGFRVVVTDTEWTFWK